MKSIGIPERCLVAESLPEFCEKWKGGKCGGYEVICGLREYYEVEIIRQKIDKKSNSIEAKVLIKT